MTNKLHSVKPYMEAYFTLQPHVHLFTMWGSQKLHRPAVRSYSFYD